MKILPNIVTNVRDNSKSALEMVRTSEPGSPSVKTSGFGTLLLFGLLIFLVLMTMVNTSGGSKRKRGRKSFSQGSADDSDYGGGDGGSDCGGDAGCD